MATSIALSAFGSVVAMASGAFEATSLRSLLRHGHTRS
jgi:hypothetical protein